MRTALAIFSASVLLTAAGAAGAMQDAASAQPGEPAGQREAHGASADRVVRAFDAAWAQRDEINDEELERLAKAAVDGLEPDKLSGVELGRILAFPTMLRTSGRDVEVRKALEKFLDAPGADGATANVQTLTARFRQAPDAEAQAELLKEAITHPALE